MSLAAVIVNPSLMTTLLKGFPKFRVIESIIPINLVQIFLIRILISKKLQRLSEFRPVQVRSPLFIELFNLPPKQRSRLAVSGSLVGFRSRLNLDRQRTVVVLPEKLEVY